MWWVLLFLLIGILVTGNISSVCMYVEARCFGEKYHNIRWQKKKEKLNAKIDLIVRVSWLFIIF